MPPMSHTLAEEGAAILSFKLVKGGKFQVSTCFLSPGVSIQPTQPLLPISGCAVITVSACIFVRKQCSALQKKACSARRALHAICAACDVLFSCTFISTARAVTEVSMDSWLILSYSLHPKPPNSQVHGHVVAKYYTQSVMSATGGGDYKASYGPCRPKRSDPRDQRHQSLE